MIKIYPFILASLFGYSIRVHAPTLNVSATYRLNKTYGFQDRAGRRKIDR